MKTLLSSSQLQKSWGGRAPLACNLMSSGKCFFDICKSICPHPKMYLSDENMLKFEHFAFLDPGVGELPLPCVQFDVFLLSLAVIVMRI